jgi:hypothetical protein
MTGRVVPGHTLLSLNGVSVEGCGIAVAQQALDDATDVRPLTLRFRETSDAGFPDVPMEPDAEDDKLGVLTAVWKQISAVALEEKAAAQSSGRDEFLRSNWPEGNVETPLLAWLELADPRPEHKLFTKRLGVFWQQEGAYACVLMKQTNLWSTARDLMAQNTKPPKGQFADVWGNIRALRNWMRSQKSKNWAEEARRIQQQQELEAGMDGGDDSKTVSIGGMSFSVGQEKEGDGETKDGGPPPPPPSGALLRQVTSSGPRSDKKRRVGKMERRVRVYPPTSFEELCEQVAQRCSFMLSLSPATWASSRTSATATAEGLAQLRQQAEELETGGAAPGAVVAPNYQGHTWRGLSLVERAEGVNVDSSGPLVDGDGEELDDSPRGLCFRECSEYARHGSVAPPTLVRTLLCLRRQRAQYRRYGLLLLAKLLRGITLRTCVYDAVLPLRPALRCRREFEGSRSGDRERDGRLRATERHHYAKVRAGAGVVQAFCCCCCCCR